MCLSILLNRRFPRALGGTAAEHVVRWHRQASALARYKAERQLAVNLDMPKEGNFTVALLWFLWNDFLIRLAKLEPFL